MSKRERDVLEDTDALIEQMQRDDLDGPPKLSPVDYGKLRGIAPQLVYYHIRAKHITISHCDCGRKVIDVQEADDFFKEAEAKKNKTGVKVDETPS